MLRTQRQPVNAHGVPQYEKGDIRRLFVLIYAIDVLESPTLVTISEFTGLNRGSIAEYIYKIGEQLDVIITKSGADYAIDSWGALLKRDAVFKHLGLKPAAFI